MRSTYNPLDNKTLNRSFIDNPNCHKTPNERINNNNIDLKLEPSQISHPQMT